MVEGIGRESGALAREAIRAAVEAQERNAERIRSGEIGETTEAAPQTGFGDQFSNTLREVNEEIVKAEQLPADFASGKIDDFHEVAIQLKRADIGFRFALEIRNKLIDAYREIMRMGV